MEEKTKIRIIQLMYLIGFILDGIVGLMMILSTFTQPWFIIPYMNTTPEFQFAMGWGASLMLGWTVLLLWGCFKPIERRNVLLMTIIPVATGLILTELIVDPIGLFNIWMSQVIVCYPVLFTGYLLALNVKRGSNEI